MKTTRMRAGLGDDKETDVSSGFSSFLLFSPCIQGNIFLICINFRLELKENIFSL